MCFPGFPSETASVPIESDIRCAESVSGQISFQDDQNEVTQYFRLNLYQDYRAVIIDLCVTNFNAVLRLLHNSSADSRIGLDDPVDCGQQYMDRLRVSASFTAHTYYIQVTNKFVSYGRWDSVAEFNLKISCVPSDSQEILQHLPLSSFSWSDAFDDPNCKNPAKGYWCAKNGHNSSSFVQVDLEAVHIIYSVSTKSAVEDNADFEFHNEWVIDYDLEYSLDGISFTSYIGNPLVYGVYDQGLWAVQNVLQTATLAKFLRFIPINYHNAKTMQIRAVGKSLVDNIFQNSYHLYL